MHQTLLKVDEMRLILVLIMMALAGCSSMRTKDNARTEAKTSPPRLLSSDILNAEEIPVKKTMVQRIRGSFPWNKATEPLSPTTIRIMNDYLEDNELEALNIEFQTENPKNDWDRLEANSSINPLLKYSLGSLDWLSNAITKPSVWGRNYYDPYTNTMHINSNNPIEIIAEMSYAKIIQRQNYPGLYALGSKLPFISFWAQKQKTNEMIAYAKSKQDWELEKATIRKMYPGMLNGSSKDIGRVAGLFFGPFYLRPAISVGGVLVGYTIAEWEISKRENEITKAAYSQKQENTPNKTDSKIERASFIK
ncbi:MAG: hypothetical protein DWH70_09630 [Planctomycetota bacterium]|nr:MAG: hypothetical protein DWH70_09630 [Planctomycetota bacterium]